MSATLRFLYSSGEGKLSLMRGVNEGGTSSICPDMVALWGEVVRVEKVVERGKVRSWSLRADTRPIIDRQSVLEGHNLFYSGPSQPWF